MEPSEYPGGGNSPDQQNQEPSLQNTSHRRSPPSDHEDGRNIKKRYTSVTLSLMETPVLPRFKLRFINSLPSHIYTYSKIQLEIELVDVVTNTRVTVDPLSSSRIEIVALNSDFPEGTWTTEDFNRNILRPPEGQSPLLVGHLSIRLENGVGVIDSVAFTDSSRRLRSAKFRLGAKATGGGVVEAITEAFVCRPYKKERLLLPYNAYNEVSTLKGFTKDCLTALRFGESRIHTIQDLRRYLAINSNALPRILEGRISQESWDAIVSQAMTCAMNDECYMYYAKSQRAFLLFNSFYEVMKVSFDGITVLNAAVLTSNQEAFLDVLKREAYENINSFIVVDSEEVVEPPGPSPWPLLSLLDEAEFSSPGPQSICKDEGPSSWEFVGALSNTSDFFGTRDKWILSGNKVKNKWLLSSSSTYYDVVIRYRRGEISNDFISHLRAALCRRGISVNDFDEVSTQVQSVGDRAVPKCKILIIFLTSTYVSSSLLNILEDQRREYLVVYPIFYGLSPSDLLSISQNYERDFLQDEQKRWWDALKEMTQMHGYILTDKCESECIDAIVRDAVSIIYSNIKANMSGISVQVDQILSMLGVESPDVHSVGIWGTVGIGKTAIAAEIFRRISVQYETCVFLKDLHEEVEIKGPDAVREDFLYKILEVEPHVLQVCGIKTSFLKSRLQRKRVLVILDDVNDFRDVETFLEMLSYVGPGSRIIITSRNRRVFVLCKVDHVYEVKPLDTSKSLQLLECGTLQSVMPPKPSRKLSLDLVTFANGNPQVLRYLSNAHEKWDRLSQQVQQSFPIYIPGIFERSCCGLDDNERSIFLDIACFFRRMDKDNVAMLLDGCGFSAHVGFKSLVDKSLLTISQNLVDMHSYIQATGREIVQQESATRPGNHSRLWNPKDIRDVFIDDSGTSAVEGIFLDMSKLIFDAKPNVFEKMCNLRLLKFYFSKMGENHGVSLPEGLKSLPSKLRLLHWESYPLKSLPRSFDPKNLVELNLPSNCMEKLWKGTKNLEKLKKMRLSYCIQLTKIPRLSSALNLEHIDLEGCSSLVSIGQSISNLKKLVFLNLKDCSKLESVPSMVGLESLEVLNLSGCSKLENFPEISPNVKELYMGGTMIQEIPSSIKNLVLLEKLDLENSKHLENILTSICKLKHLETLNLSGCSRLERFPDLSRRMKCLRFLDLSRTGIKELPSSISYLTALEELRFVDCKNLVRLPDNAWSLPFKVEFRQIDTEKFSRLWNRRGWLKKVQTFMFKDPARARPRLKQAA